MMHKNDFMFSYDLRVRFAEVDYQGVVFNAHYLTYLDTALTEYMRYLGMDVSLDGNPKQFDFQLVKTTLEYKAPAKFDEELAIAVRTQKIGNASIVFDAGVFRKKDDQLLVTAELLWVYADLIGQVSTPMPQTIRAFFEKEL